MVGQNTSSFFIHAKVFTCSSEMLRMQTNPVYWWKHYGQSSYGIIKDFVKPTLCPALRCSLQGNRCLIPSTVFTSARISLLMSLSPSLDPWCPHWSSLPHCCPFPLPRPLVFQLDQRVLRWLTWIIVVSLVRGISGISPLVVLVFRLLSEEKERIWWIRTSFGRMCFRTGTHLAAVCIALLWKVCMTFLLAQRQLVMLRTLMSPWPFLPSVWDQNLGNLGRVCLVVVEVHIAVGECATNSSRYQLAVSQGMIFHPWDFVASFWHDPGNHSNHIGSSVVGVLDQHLLLLPTGHQLMLPCPMIDVYR